MILLDVSDVDRVVELGMVAVLVVVASAGGSGAFAPFILHDVDLAAIGPPTGFVHHPESRP